MPAKLIETTWGDFSSRFVSFQRLPHGTELRLFDSDGRKKRSDWTIKRRPIRSGSLDRVSDEDNVRTLLDSAIDSLSTDLRARKLRLELFGPAGQNINGNTLLRRVRKLAPKPTEADLQYREIENALGDQLKESALSSIRESEHLVDDPSTTVCQAYVDALVERYGRRAVLDALGK